MAVQTTHVALFPTCLTDTLFPDTARATVRLLERLGCTVDFPLDATCCGQLLDDDAEIVSVARALSQARNRLAHPKTREGSAAGSSHVSPMRHPLDLARESVANMNQFFQLFASFEPDSSDIVHAI